MDNKIPVIVVVGPTASGKTTSSIYLAKRFNGEIVSADSMQIYKGMDIGTAKPSEEEQEGIPHHMMNIVEYDQNYSVSDYVQNARQIIKEIHNRKKLPIVVGGTGLYINALIDNIQFQEMKRDNTLRQELEQRAQVEGGEKLLEELRCFDPQTADQLHPNNTKRIVRAIEVYKLTGKTMTEHRTQSRLKQSEYHACIIGLCFSDRQLLYERINRRVDQMLATGLLTEAEQLYKSNKSVTAMQAIGYKELFCYFDGCLTLEEAVDQIKKKSRRYAKRQMTWFRKDNRIQWIKVDVLTKNETIFKQLEIIVEKHLNLCYNNQIDY